MGERFEGVREGSLLERAAQLEAEVERLRGAIEEHTAWTIGAKVDPFSQKATEWRHDQALRAALSPDDSRN